MSTDSDGSRFSPGDRVVVRQKKLAFSGVVVSYRMDEDDIGRNFDERVVIELVDFPGPRGFTARSMGGQASNHWRAVARTGPQGLVRIEKAGF